MDGVSERDWLEVKSEWRDCVGVCEAECGMDEEKVM